MINKNSKIIKLIKFFSNEKIILPIIIFLLFWYLIYLFTDYEIIYKIVDFLSKIFVVFWIIWIFEISNRLIQQEEILNQNINKLDDKIDILFQENKTLNIELLKHISLDLERDKKFIKILEELEILIDENLVSKKDYIALMNKYKNANWNKK